MPARYVIHKELRLVVNYGWDRLTLGDFRSQQEAMANDPGFNPSFGQLVDVTQHHENWTRTGPSLPRQRICLTVARAR